MDRRVLCLCLTAALMLTANAFPHSFLSQYKGLPYRDTLYLGGPQKVPGRVLCAYYDLGGEGVAYHDSDPQNRGSGALNPADGTYLNEFASMREWILRTRSSTASQFRSTTTPSTRSFLREICPTLAGPSPENGSI